MGRPQVSVSLSSNKKIQYNTYVTVIIHLRIRTNMKALKVNCKLLSFLLEYNFLVKCVFLKETHTIISVASTLINLTSHQK